MVGIAVCLFILLFVHDELSYDQFHEHGNRIFRLTRQSANDSETRGYANTSAAAGPMLKSEYSDVERMVRFMMPMPREIQIKYDELRFVESGLYWADKEVFELFDFSLHSGDPASALAEPFTVVVTKNIAEKYFGDADPIGKTLTIDGWVTKEYVVTGILKRSP